MKRRHLVELEDLPWWPRVFRDAGTDYLVTAIRHAKVYDGHAPRLAAAVKRAGADRIIDLCSGGGGPWPTLLPALRAGGLDVPVHLTDKYPNAAALRRVAATTPGVTFEPEPVSATEVPARLTGDLTSPPERRQFLRGWYDSGQVSQVGGPGSHLVAHLARANCLVVVPEDVTALPAGAEVDVVLIEGALQ